MTDTPFALGQAGEVVRVIMVCDEASARHARQDGELLMRLDRVPDERVMITADGTDVVAMPETGAEKSERLWREIRARRNAILDSSRWTVAPDSPLSAECQAQWLAFLKTLNRITVDYSDPTAVDWPTPPSLAYD